ncbi:hypothetical protein BCU84_18865 [Shewanella sp. 10N.286.51.B7]|uniref:hypothetical protein n=1 Tax=Shewanella sp. 10N.286.51.B7 TaxID=1880836 RepID=UPI000C826ED6|nr:hypothetical protein [Shewanella sp. 10N.286.51.B7]PMG73675.1 hypothetical protein BCU84_18865 [Shewanella sp. 10N.286.51.B7]
MPYPDMSGARTTEKMVKEVIAEMREQGNQSSLNAKISLLISFVALAIALSSLYFSYKDSTEDSEWQNEQIRLLKEIAEKPSVVSVSGNEE